MAHLKTTCFGAALVAVALLASNRPYSAEPLVFHPINTAAQDRAIGEQAYDRVTAYGPEAVGGVPPANAAPYAAVFPSAVVLDQRPSHTLPSGGWLEYDAKAPLRAVLYFYRTAISIGPRRIGRPCRPTPSRSAPTAGGSWLRMTTAGPSR